MPEPAHDLLSDELLEVGCHEEGAPRRLSLPGVFEALASGDRISSFSELQAHQSQAWYCFLCQLAAITLARADVDTLEEASGRWTELLLALTDAQREPWCLVVPDLSRPAFLQPPVPEGEWSALDKTVEQPDDLDLLVTSTNHDVKITRIDRPEPAHWIYALVSLQTMANFGGFGNYGVARKSSGYSCRPFVGVAPGLGWGERFRRDVRVLLDARNEIAERHGFDADGSLALLHLAPWDGTDMLPIEELDPYFVEVCRRVRLKETTGGLVARRTTTRSRRVAAKELTGNVGDPWTPIRVSDGTALNVTGSGFGYELVTDLVLTGEYQPGAAGRIHGGDPDEPYLICQALSRGQGQTDGLHERIVPIPGHVRPRLMQADTRDELAERAQNRIEFVGTVQSSALRPALCVLFQGDPESLDFQDDRPRPWLRRHDGRIDRIFFERLWEHAELPADEAARAWEEEVVEIAADVLEEAMQRAAVPEARHYRGLAGAERVFAGARRKLLGAPDEENREAIG